MSKHHMCKLGDFIHTPIEPVPVKKGTGVRKLLHQMSEASFQGRKLGEALKVWEAMIDSGCYIYLGMAGALIPAGMRKIIDYLVRTGKVHSITSTGANLFHELYEAIGYRHYKGNPRMDDLVLKDLLIDRIYDTLAPDVDFLNTDEVVRDFSRELAKKMDKVATHVYFRELGAWLKKKGKKSFIVTAYEKGVPIYCPAIADSSYGIGMAAFGEEVKLCYDFIGDLVDITTPISQGKATGVVYLGGGTPKNFIQQAEIIAQERLRHEENLTVEEAEERLRGHEYAIQISSDVPQWGGLSGCTLEEGQSWGKESPDAQMVNLYCEVTIALPLLANALAERDKK